MKTRQNDNQNGAQNVIILFSKLTLNRIAIGKMNCRIAVIWMAKSKMTTRGTTQNIMECQISFRALNVVQPQEDRAKILNPFSVHCTLMSNRFITVEFTTDLAVEFSTL